MKTLYKNPVVWLAVIIGSAYLFRWFPTITTQIVNAQERVSILPPPKIGILETNDTTSREVLGRKLFFDPILSANGKVSCSTCHNPQHGYASTGRPLGLDGYSLSRKAPTLHHQKYGKSFFWDGRASSLEEQALQPIRERKEMGNVTITPVVERLKSSSYKKLFDREFDDGVTADNLATVLADFERTIQYPSGLDFYLSGKITYTESMERGYKLFTGRANCYRCHPVKDGAPLTDNEFHNTGVGGGDLGRYYVTHRSEDMGKFKTPTLRGCVKTAPYMHNASIKTLDDVIDFYDRGGNKRIEGEKDIRIFPLGLTPQEKHDLYQFLVNL